jgi:predicted NAD/FAD-binding protein
MRVAIVGSGVAGLVAARELSAAHAITVFERNDYLGGHAHTVVVQDGDRDLALDTGFVVFNRQNYPLFSRLLQDLDVACQPSEMSFGVGCRRCGIEYSSRGLRGLLAKPAQALRPRFLRMAADIVRFNRWARRHADDPDHGARTLGDLRDDRRYGQDLFPHYLVPMTGAIWSSTGLDVDAMPLAFLLTFYRNHGLLQTHRHPQWRTVTGGSRRYVEALSRPFLNRVRVRTPVLAIRRHVEHVEVRTADGWERFDTVVLATHTDQALRMLEDPTAAEGAALSAIAYRRNEAVLHTDDQVLAAAPAARASWNCHLDDCAQTAAPLRMTYYLNRLQGLDSATSYCVTLNDDGRIAPDRILTRMVYDHPLYTVGGLQARHRLRALSGQRHTVFCGAYMGNGFHEDGVRSGMEAAQLVATHQEAA